MQHLSPNNPIIGQIAAYRSGIGPQTTISSPLIFDSADPDEK